MGSGKAIVLGEPQIRRIVTWTEVIREDGGKPLASEKRVAAVAAIIKNPYAGTFVEDLIPLVDAYAPSLGELLSSEIAKLMPEGIEAYGKAAIVGLGGEVEVGSAIIHTLKFGNPFRRAARAETLLPAVEKVAPPGAVFDVPLKHILNDRTRSHHQTYTMQVPDAPRADEIIVALVATNAGRPHARIGEFRADEGD